MNPSIRYWINKHYKTVLNIDCSAHDKWYDEFCNHNINYHLGKLYVRHEISIANNRRESLEYFCYRFIR